MFYKCFFIGISLLTFVYSDDTQFSLFKNIQFEALKKGGFRAYITDLQGLSFFALHANINTPIKFTVPGETHKETKSPNDGFWILEFNNKLRVGDVIYYWAAATYNHLLYKVVQSWTVNELHDSYKNLNKRCNISDGQIIFEDEFYELQQSCLFEDNKCRKSGSVVNSRSVCSDKLIFEDNFDGSEINTRKWIIEQDIPTYLGPVFEFNSYENQALTRFIKNGHLYLQPIYLNSLKDVEGVLDLRKGCTSEEEDKCYYQSVGSFILPPTKSAKIKSKISFKYGKIQIKAQMPFGDWLFPIIKLIPKDYNENDTTIWIAYSRGNNHLIGNAADDIGSRLLFAGPALHPSEPQRSKKLVTRINSEPYSNHFHIYTLIWEPDKMTFFYDSEKFGQVNLHSPSFFEKEYTISLGVGVGGFDDFPDDYISGSNPKPWINRERNCVWKFFENKEIWSKSWKNDETALKVDYVKVWTL